METVLPDSNLVEITIRVDRLEAVTLRMIDKLRDAQEELVNSYEAYGRADIFCLGAIQKRREFLKGRIGKCTDFIQRYVIKKQGDKLGVYE